VQEHGQTASHSERQNGPSTRPKQLRHIASRLRNREVSWAQGLSGTAGRELACPVVWEPGEATLPATRLGAITFISLLFAADLH